MRTSSVMLVVAELDKEELLQVKQVIEARLADMPADSTDDWLLPGIIKELQDIMTY